VIDLQENEEEAKSMEIFAFPTIRFFRSGENEPYLPPGKKETPPWDESGLIGAHLEEIEFAIRQISTTPGLDY
jgi:hypothetical protein